MSDESENFNYLMRRSDMSAIGAKRKSRGHSECVAFDPFLPSAAKFAVMQNAASTSRRR